MANVCSELKSRPADLKVLTSAHRYFKLNNILYKHMFAD